MPGRVERLRCLFIEPGAGIGARADTSHDTNADTRTDWINGGDGSTAQVVCLPQQTRSTLVMKRSGVRFS